MSTIKLSDDNFTSIMWRRWGGLVISSGSAFLFTYLLGFIPKLGSQPVFHFCLAVVIAGFLGQVLLGLKTLLRWIPESAFVVGFGLATVGVNVVFQTPWFVQPLMAVTAVSAIWVFKDLDWENHTRDELNLTGAKVVIMLTVTLGVSVTPLAAFAAPFGIFGTWLICGIIETVQLNTLWARRSPNMELQLSAA